MTTVLDFEHQALARLLSSAARVAHGDQCELCTRLGVRRTLDGLAAQIRAGKVNDTPHGDPPPTKPKNDPPPQKNAAASALASRGICGPARPRPRRSSRSSSTLQCVLIWSKSRRLRTAMAT